MLTREVLWNGNRESFWLTFFSRDSVLFELYQKRDKLRRLAEVTQAQTPSRIRLEILRSARELERFYEAYGLVRR